MLLSPRISGKRLSDLCHRLAMGLAAGVDLRNVWKRETENARGSVRDQFRRVQDDIERGRPFAESLAKTGKLFPPLFLEMVGVGERTGQTSEVLNKLEHHYRVRHELTRGFALLLAWPMIQLTMGLFVVGLLIWIFGALDVKDLNGKPVDPLGLGLKGTSGLITYVLMIGTCVAAIVGFVVAMRRGALWMKPVQLFFTKLPGVGAAIQKICLSRIAWTLHLLLNVEMDVRQMIPLVLKSTGNAFYTQHQQQMVADVSAGQPLYLAFANSGAFPPPFLDALAVAEESGQISESMARLTTQYEGEAETAMRWIAGAVGLAIWLGVGALLILFIFRLAGFYLGTIQQAIDMGK
jgi:type II secretory pathway component PulF